MSDLKLAYGLRSGIPDDVAAVWGARWIWPNDLVFDRQDAQPERGTALRDLLLWLNDGPLRLAQEEAARLARNYELGQTDDRTVTLYEDGTGIVQANPQGSSGYLYVAAWLKASPVNTVP